MSATATHATVQRSTRRTGLEPGALWEDAKLGFAHMFDWDRFAVVTDLEWISRTTKFMAMLMPMEGRVYPMAEAAKAREWISEKT